MSTRASSTWDLSTRSSNSSTTSRTSEDEWEDLPQWQTPFLKMSHYPQGNQHLQGDSYAAIFFPESGPLAPFPPSSLCMRTTQPFCSDYGGFHDLESGEELEPAADDAYAPMSFPIPTPPAGYGVFAPPFGTSTQTYNIPRDPPLCQEATFPCLGISASPTPYQRQQSRPYGAYSQPPYHGRSPERTSWAWPRNEEAENPERRLPIMHGGRSGLGRDNKDAEDAPGDYVRRHGWKCRLPQRPRERSPENDPSDWKTAPFTRMNKYPIPRSSYKAGSAVQANTRARSPEPKPPAAKPRAIYKNLPRRRLTPSPSPPTSPERTPPSLIIVDPPAEPRTWRRGRAASRGTWSAATRGDSPDFVYGGGSVASGSRTSTLTEASLGRGSAARPRNANAWAPVAVEDDGEMMYPDWRDGTAAQSRQTQGTAAAGPAVAPLAGGGRRGGGVYTPVLTPVMW